MILLYYGKKIEHIACFIQNKEKKKGCFDYSNKFRNDFVILNYPFPKSSARLYGNKSNVEENITNVITNLITISKLKRVYIHAKDETDGRLALICGLILYYNNNMIFKECLNSVFSLFKKSMKVSSQQYQTLYRIIQNKPYDILFFNEKNDPNYVFSNYYTRKQGKTLFVDEKNREWLSSEAYFQAHKFPEDSKIFYYIRVANTPNKSKCIGQQKLNGQFAGSWYLTKEKKIKLSKAVQDTKHFTIRENWDDVKEIIMQKALHFKFTQNSDLLHCLLTSTGNLHEYSPYDSFWGTYWNQKGNNKLGQLLMRLRTRLQ